MLARTPSPHWWCCRCCCCYCYFGSGDGGVWKFLFAILTHSDIDIIDLMRTKFHGPHLYFTICIKYIYAYVCILLSSFFKSKCAYLTMYIHILYKVSQNVHIYIYIHMCFSRYKEISHSCCCYYCYYYSCMFMILMAIGFVWSEPLCIAKYLCVNGVWYGLLFDEQIHHWMMRWNVRLFSMNANACMYMLTCLTKNTNRQPHNQQHQ